MMLCLGPSLIRNHPLLDRPRAIEAELPAGLDDEVVGKVSWFVEIQRFMHARDINAEL